MSADWAGWLALQAALYAVWAAGIVFLAALGVRSALKWMRSR